MNLLSETGLGSATWARLMKREPVASIEGQTLAALCQYFNCGVGDILEYVPEATAPQ